MAPRLKLDAERLEQIARALAVGATLEAAARASGIGPRTLDRWLEKARSVRERDDTPGVKVDSRDRIFLELLDAIEREDAAAEVKALATVQRSSLNGDWRAAAWFLERVHPERYAPARGTGKMGRPIGSASAPDRRPGTGGEPPRLRLAGTSS